MQVNSKRRKGVIVPLTAILMVFLLGMVAFALDIGFILVARTQAQSAADAAALAGASKLMHLLQSAPLEKGENYNILPVQTTTHLGLARQEAIAFAAANKISNNTVEVLASDIEIGFMANPVSLNSDILETSNWPTRPYNTVRVTVRRDDLHYGGKLTLIFGHMFGLQSVEISATATAAFMVGTPVYRGNYSTQEGGQTVNYSGGLLPFTFEEKQWNAMMDFNGIGTTTYINFLGETESMTISDNYNKVGQAGADGVREFKMFPSTNSSGNFGTINFTMTKFGNSTKTLEDLILNGPSEAEWPALNTILQATTATNGGKLVNGDPGLSGGMEDAVLSIIGQLRILPLFRTVTLDGGNVTYYELVDFKPIVIVAADLSGGNKYIQFQPGVLSAGANIGSTSGRLNFDILPGNGVNPDFSALGRITLVR